MDKEQKATATHLIKAVVILQLKVLLGAARDLAVGPLAIAAALADLVLLKQQKPRFFGQVLRFGELSDLGPAGEQYVVGDPPPRIGARHERVGEPGQRRASGVPRRPGRQSQI